MAEPWERTARRTGSSESGTAGSHPRRSSGCQARPPCRLIGPGCATCRRSGFRVIYPHTVRPSFWRLPQPIRRLLLLTHPRDLQLPDVDLLAHQSEANSLTLRVAPGTTDEHVDVGHAPPSLPCDPDWRHAAPFATARTEAFGHRRTPTPGPLFCTNPRAYRRRLQALRNPPGQASRTAIALPNRSVHREFSHAVAPVVVATCSGPGVDA
jgi:hypothetical protein